MSPARVIALLACLASTAACAGDETTATSESETGGEPLGGPARGVSIVGVEANQGTAVMLTDGDAYIQAEDRSAYLVSSRDTLIRFQHVIDDPETWIPRELVGILHIYPPGDDGDELIRERRMFVEADSDPRNITTNFYFSLLASEAVVGTRFWLELREGDPDIDVSALSEGLVAAPVDPEPFGFESSPQQMRVVIVPVDYRYPDPPRLASLSADEVQLFHDELLQQNPLQTIDIQIRDEPLVWDEQLTNLGELLPATSALREADEAAPNVYYHSFVDVNGNAVNMVAGIAFLTNDERDHAHRRVAATVLHRHVSPGDEETGEPPTIHPPTDSARTWVHEIGHNQGLSHVFCPGADAAGPNPDYPHENGKIGAYGFGIRNFHMYTPTASHDYMTYCGNSWVSDWTWNKTFERIRELTSWDFEGAPVEAAPKLPQLLGLVFADGSESWWVERVPAPSERSGAELLEFWRGGELIGVEVASVQLLSDGQTLELRAPLPDAGIELDAIVRIDHRGTRHPLALERVRGR